MPLPVEETMRKLVESIKASKQSGGEGALAQALINEAERQRRIVEEQKAMLATLAALKGAGRK